jgi:CubicO group peptidase (beta-lactamase class C family)
MPVPVRVLVALTFALAAPAAFGQGERNKLTAAEAAAVDRAVRDEMKKQQVVGVAVGVIRNREVAYVNGYGLADREKRTPATADTVFNWASNSKPLAAVAALQLVEKKLLDLDADVRTYVPEFPDKGAVITTRQLLCHQSGLPHYANGKVVATDRTYKEADPYLDPVHALDKFNKSPLIFPPGEKADYSSYAYVLLSAVVQRAGKEPFDQQVQARVGKPLGLASLQQDVAAKGQPHWAAGYVKDKDGAVAPTAEDAHYWKHGAGGYKSNVRDFARWARAVLARELVTATTETAMWTPQKLRSGGETKWGLGFTVEQQGGLKVSHNGSQPEATTRMVLYPRAGTGVVVMTNCRFAEVGAISTAVFAALKE